MATRAIIGEELADGTFRGVYHHNDGDPSWLGQTLYEQATRPEFIYDLPRMLKILIDDNPAGWSTINKRDLLLPAIWSEFDEEYYRGKHPISYTKRGEEPNIMHQGDPLENAEYAYLINVEKRIMKVYTVASDNETLIFRLTVPLGGSDEPDWSVFE